MTEFRRYRRGGESGSGEQDDANGSWCRCPVVGRATKKEARELASTRVQKEEESGHSRQGASTIETKDHQRGTVAGFPFRRRN